MRSLLACFVMAFILLSGSAFADVYDDLWIRQCISDNQDQGQTSETIRVYCTCMNDKMSNEEARSITTWEKTHPEEMAYCANLAGWRGR